MSNIPELREWVAPHLHSVLLPTLAVLFGLPVASLYAEEVFIVKYDASVPGGQRMLSSHRDGSTFSFNVLLSEPGVAFEGGGTRFETLGITVSAGVGDVVLHCGQMLHGGGLISRGTRYILVGFIEVAPGIRDVVTRARSLVAEEEEEEEEAELLIGGEEDKEVKLHYQGKSKFARMHAPKMRTGSVGGAMQAALEGENFDAAGRSREIERDEDYLALGRFWRAICITRRT